MFRLSSLQRPACLGITGAMKSTPTSAMKNFLDLPPLHLVIQGEARMGLYRLQNTLPLSLRRGAGHELIKEKIGGSNLEMNSDYMTPKLHHNIPFEVKIGDRSEWTGNHPEFPSGAIIWYTDARFKNRARNWCRSTWGKTEKRHVIFSG